MNINVKVFKKMLVNQIQEHIINLNKWVSFQGGKNGTKYATQ